MRWRHSLAVLLLGGGCSWVFSKPPTTNASLHTPQARTQIATTCAERPLAPVVDASLGSLLAGAGFVVVADGEDDAVAVGAAALLVALPLLLSAGHGYRAAEGCAIASDAAAGSRFQARPRAVRAAFGVGASTPVVGIEGEHRIVGPISVAGELGGSEGYNGAYDELTAAGTVRIRTITHAVAATAGLGLAYGHYIETTCDGTCGPFANQLVKTGEIVRAQLEASIEYRSRGGLSLRNTFGVAIPLQPDPSLPT